MNMSQFLLIHGAFHGAWCWHKAIPELEKRGHRARAIDLPGQGQDQTPLGNVMLDTMVDRIVTALTEMAGPVVLVGHSLAGMVISATAEKAPDRIKTLVFLSAFLPRDGESLLAMEHRNPKAAVQIA
jgi:pimeloyl-ACP methyl ester carboxylesterase